MRIFVPTFIYLQARVRVVMHKEVISLLATRGDAIVPRASRQWPSAGAQAATLLMLQLINRAEFDIASPT